MMQEAQKQAHLVYLVVWYFVSCLLWALHFLYNPKP
jgi:hypothetical protein